MDDYSDFEFKYFNDFNQVDVYIQDNFLYAQEEINDYLIRNFDHDLDTYLGELIKGQYACIYNESQFLYISYLLFIVFFFFLFVTLYLVFSHKVKRNEKSDEIILENNLVKRKILKKDWAFAPFLKEERLMITVQVLFFFTQLATFLIFANLFEVRGINKIPYIDTIIDVLQAAIPTLNIMILFLNLSTKIINKEPLKLGISYLIFGMMFSGLSVYLFMIF